MKEEDAAAEAARLHHLQRHQTQGDEELLVFITCRETGHRVMKSCSSSSPAETPDTG